MECCNLEPVFCVPPIVSHVNESVEKDSNHRFLDASILDSSCSKNDSAPRVPSAVADSDADVELVAYVWAAIMHKPSASSATGLLCKTVELIV